MLHLCMFGFASQVHTFAFQRRCFSQARVTSDGFYETCKSNDFRAHPQSVFVTSYGRYCFVSLTKDTVEREHVFSIFKAIVRFHLAKHNTQSIKKSCCEYHVKLGKGFMCSNNAVLLKSDV